MLSKTDLYFSAVRTGLLLACTGLLMGACVARPFAPAPERSALATPPPPAVAPDARPPEIRLTTPPRPTDEGVAAVLAYADRVRTLSPAELATETGRPAEAGPAEQLQLALALSQLRQLNELLRAQELVSRVLSDASAEAQTLHPLARLMAARYAEQRRLEDQLERQNQHLRDVQRRLEQTSERLEALKAIERSLSSRPGPPVLAAPLAPASRPAKGRGRSTPP